jgi:hypothetical protein
MTTMTTYAEQFLAEHGAELQKHMDAVDAIFADAQARRVDFDEWQFPDASLVKMRQAGFVATLEDNSNDAARRLRNRS